MSKTRHIPNNRIGGMQKAYTMDTFSLVLLIKSFSKRIDMFISFSHLLQTAVIERVC